MARRHRLLAVAVSGALVLGVADAAGADTVRDKQREAQQVAAQLDAMEVTAATLDEDVAEAQEELAAVSADARAAERDLAALQTELQGLRSRLGDLALTAYVKGGDQGGGVAGMLAGGALAGGAVQRQGYAQIAYGRTADVADEVAAKREDAAALSRYLEAKQEQQAALTETIKRKQQDADKAVAQYEQLLQKVQGELAVAVEQERQRQEAEQARQAAARARELAEQYRREQAEAARRAARQQGGGSSAGSGGGSGSGSGGGSTATTRPRRTPTTTASGGGPTPTQPPRDRPGGNIPAPAPGAAGAVAAAMSQLGVPYRRYTMNPGVSFDCSGLTTWAWSRAGVSLPRSSRMQYAALPKIPADQAQPGDLFFFGNPIHHVGMYVGGGNMIEAPYTGSQVRIRGAFRRDLVGVARPG